MKQKIDRHKSYMDSCVNTMGMVHTYSIIYCRTNPQDHDFIQVYTRDYILNRLNLPRKTKYVHYASFVIVHKDFSKSSILSVFLYFPYSCILGRIYALYYTFMPYKHTTRRFHFS